MQHSSGSQAQRQDDDEEPARHLVYFRMEKWNGPPNPQFPLRRTRTALVSRRPVHVGKMRRNDLLFASRLLPHLEREPHVGGQGERGAKLTRFVWLSHKALLTHRSVRAVRIGALTEGNSVCVKSNCTPASPISHFPRL